MFDVLIETLWNVKYPHVTAQCQLLSRINRNIVECKVAPLTGNYFFCDLCINRNIVECKVRPVCKSSRFRVVLIETLWNVKTANAIASIADLDVLIETLWNVKFLQLSLLRCCLRINRNIVECKEESTGLPSSRVSLY